MSTSREFLAGFVRPASTQTTTRSRVAATESNTRPRHRPKSRFFNIKEYARSTVSKARELLNKPVFIDPLLIPSDIPIDRYLPPEIHLEIFSYLPWESQFACSVASRIWKQILWIHGQSSSLIDGYDRYCRASLKQRYHHHKIFDRRTCELRISNNGIDVVGVTSTSHWKPRPTPLGKIKPGSRRQLRDRRDTRRDSFSSTSSSGSDLDSSSDSSSSDEPDSGKYGRSTKHKDSDSEGGLETVWLDPQQSFIMNDVLLKPNPKYVLKNPLYTSLIRSSGIKDPLVDLERCSITLLLTHDSDGFKLFGERRPSTWALATDEEREAVTVRAFLEHVARAVKGGKELEEGEVKKVNLKVKLVGQGNIIFMAYVKDGVDKV
ncbi:hypothetical protein TWF730_008069 [Orbilia blumenaviensis]|uniref:F-box domain-containing protein n=1 Tax=Orbilia blumenaviensis TaxID=1796055 RepID=A0AAV9VDG2_9PEZI